MVETATQTAKRAKPKTKRRRYSKGNFAATTVGPHGAAVRIYERDGSGTAWISYVWERKPVKRSLGYRLYNAHGQVDAEVQNTLNDLQKRASELLQQGQNPRHHDLRRKAPQRELTLAAAFDIYLGDEGRRRLEQAAPPAERLGARPGDWYPRPEHGHPGGHPSRPPSRLPASPPTIQAESRIAAARRGEADAAALKKREEVGRLDQKKGYHRRAADQRMPKRKVQHLALRQSGAAHVQDGLRQATIEVRCVLAMLRWLSDEYEVPNVPTFSRPRFLARANEKGPAPGQEHFTDEEVTKIERRLPTPTPASACCLPSRTRSVSASCSGVAVGARGGAGRAGRGRERLRARPWPAEQARRPVLSHP